MHGNRISSHTTYASCNADQPCDVLTLPFLPAADANILINMCRLAAQRYRLAYQEPMPVEQLVQAVCDTKQVMHIICRPLRLA